MKKIVFVLLSFIIFFLVGCNKNEVIIIFNIEENIIEKLYEKGIIIDENILNTITDEEVDGIYYDNEFINEYKNEEIVENTTLYLKFVKEESEAFIYEGITKELYSQIITDYILLEYEDIYLDIYDDDVRFDDYIGVFGDAVVSSYYNPYEGGIIYGDAYKFNFIWYEMIEDIKLYYDNTNIYRVWKDSKFYTLSEAYNNKILSYEHIKQISEILYNNIDISKIDENIEFNGLCDFNECTILSYIISISTSANFYVEITQEKIIDHILNNYFISKNIQLQFNDNIKNQPSSLLNISLRFNWIDESYLTMCITRDGKLYIRTMFGYWLESVDTNIIDIEELENYLNNLNIS